MTQEALPTTVGDHTSEVALPTARRGLDAHLIAVVTLWITVALGFALRLVAVFRLSPHVDEAASILAANVVARDLVPVLPSGTVYFQGYTLSLLLAPFVWLGHGGLADLLLLRLASTVAGTAAIYLVYRLALCLTSARSVGLLSAGFLAVDPLSVQWGGHVRMYALLQLVVLGLAWAFAIMVRNGPNRRRILLVVALAWLAVFTHVGAALVIVALLASVAIVYRRDTFRLPALWALMTMSSLAPVALLAANRLLTPPSATRSGDESSTGLWFVGNSQVEVLGLLDDRSLSDVLALLQRETVEVWLTPVSMVFLGALGAGLVLLAGKLFERRDEKPLLHPSAASFLFLAYWITTIAFVLLSRAMAGRYLLHVQALGYVFMATLVVGLARAFRTRWSLPGLVPGALAGGAIAALVILLLGNQVRWRMEHTVINADYHAAIGYVAEHHAPGQPVIVALPPPAYLGLEPESRGDLYFLAGPADGDRARDYSRITLDGDRIDYWVGAHTIVSASELRQLLIQHPDAWLVLDSYRLSVSWGYQGEIEDTIREMTLPAYRGPGGVMVLTVDLPPGVMGPHRD